MLIKKLEKTAHKLHFDIELILSHFTHPYFLSKLNLGPTLTSICPSTYPV